MSARLMFLCSVLIAVLAETTGCQSSEHPKAEPVTAVLRSTASAGAAHTGQAPAAPECDPRASLRPQYSLPAPGQMPANSRMAIIAKRGFLIAGVDRDVDPFAVRNRDLRWEGYDVDIVRDIARAIFGDPEKVRYLPLNEADRVTAVRSGDVDVSVATITITCERRQDAEFSIVYFEAAQRVLVNKGSGIKSLADLGGKRVCAGGGTTSIERIRKAPSKPIPVAVPASEDCLAMIERGDVDAVSTDDAMLAGMAKQDPQAEVVGPGFSEEPYGVAINRDHADLARFINAVLERRTQDGRWQASYQHWLEPVLGPLPPAPTPRYRDQP
jgi:polar amino acid transport system substrate-binding protein